MHEPSIVTTIASEQRMDEFPHVYAVESSCGPSGRVALASPGVPALESDAPRQFAGPGDRWSPEGLLLGALIDCLSLSFRASASASKLPWLELRCKASGTLDRVDGALRFTAIRVQARLRIPAGDKPDRAQRLLERAKRNCPVSNSLALEVEVEASVEEA
jgi:organic hydroperoxide reductase OsmC/OhrA